MFYLTFQTHLNVLILRNKQLERKLTQNVFQFISWVFVLIFFINWNFSLGPFNVFIAKMAFLTVKFMFDMFMYCKGPANF